MKRTAAAALACLSLQACVSTGERDYEVTPPTTLSTRVGNVLDLDLPSGRFVITPSLDGELHASVTFFCDPNSERCLENAARAGIVHEQNGDHSYLRFKPDSAYSTRHANLVFRIRIPNVTQLNVTAGAGDIAITSPTACVSVRAGAGDLSIAVPESDIASADLDANLGDSSLKTPDGYADDRRPLLVGSEVQWAEGPGRCALRARLQAGAINVRLLEDES